MEKGKQNKRSGRGVNQLKKPCLPFYLTVASVLVVVISIFAFNGKALQKTDIIEPREIVKIEQINEIVKTHLPSDGDLDAIHFAQQLYTALLNNNGQRANTIHLIGTTDNIKALKDICRHVVQELFAIKNESTFFTELEGDTDPQKFIEKIANKVSLDDACPSHTFLIGADKLTIENRDVLEGAFDDTAPYVSHLNGIVPTKCGIFVLISEISPEVNSAIGYKEKQGLLREEMTKKWTGRFYQRVRHTVGV